MKEIKIVTDFIKLDQLLKFAGIAGSGAQAKEMVLAGIVSVNGEIATQRGKKIITGDHVTVEGIEELIVI